MFSKGPNFRRGQGGQIWGGGKFAGTPAGTTTLKNSGAPLIVYTTAHLNFWGNTHSSGDLILWGPASVLGLWIIWHFRAGLQIIASLKKIMDYFDS
jgi:hypothetical protein